MSIKLKVIISIVFILFIGTLCLLYISNQSYNKNIELITNRSILTAKESFANLQKNDLKMMTAVVEELVLNKDIKDAYIKRDRDKLFEITNPKYQFYKQKFGITQWNFMDAEPENHMVLRLTMPKKFGDPIGRVTLKNAVNSQVNSYGTELGNTGFAIRVVKPYFDGVKLIGYMELGEELNRFLAVLKELSGDDYGLVLKKSLLKQSDWATTRIVLNRRNNWDDQKEILVSANTSTDESLLKYDGKIEDIPEMGKIIGEIKQGDSIFIKGIFPIYDVSKHKVGGVFVLHNITDIYMGMKASQRSTIIFIIFQAIVICIILVIILFQLVFKRLASMMDKATRVVGGDYYTKIVPKSNDEVGQFESLFDQFRAVFVDMLEQLQSKEKISNDKI